jgi:hypothetical protein
MRDFYNGERVVKEKTTAYLPSTKGMVIDGMSQGQLGHSIYSAYIKRAVFPDIVKEAIESYLGIMHRKESVIELPSIMEPLRNNCTLNNESIQMVLRKINEEQLITGRCGLLIDMPEESAVDSLPYITLYNSENITNWDDSKHNILNMVILKESEYIRIEEFEWRFVDKYRLLQIEEGTYLNGLNENGYSIDNMISPMYKGASIDFIPFTFINSKDINSSIDEPPLIGLGKSALSIYQSEADYRQNLFMQGQDTLVIIGGIKGHGDEVRVGAGSLIEVEDGGDAKYIGVSANGLSEMRTALENDYKRANDRSGKLIGASSQVESANAIRTRLEANTATLNQIAITGAKGLEKCLKMLAVWIGANPDEVIVTPNLDFISDFDLAGDDLVKLQTARSMGVPLSEESLHNLMVERGITKLDYMTEKKIIEGEENGIDNGKF